MRTLATVAGGAGADGGSFGRRLLKLLRVGLLILDDFGLKPLNQPERLDLLELIEDRHGTRSTLITSQPPISHWHEYLNDPIVADSLLERLPQNAYKLELNGESMRKDRPNLTQ